VTPQTTLAGPAVIAGHGVHSGAPATLRVLPAPPNHGRVFRRVDAPVGQGDIPARWDFVVDIRNATTLGNAAGWKIATVEHFLAACVGLELDNLLIEIDGPETPIMDGSARDFVESLAGAGRIHQNVPRRAIKILAPVEAREGDRWVRLEPAAEGLSLILSIDYADPAIGAQQLEWAAAGPDAFVADIAGARTFGFMADLEAYHARGLAKGASLANTIAVQGGRVVNPEGLRWADEFVRHKAIDALGDLALADAPLIGRMRGHANGHALHVAALKSLMQSDGWAYA
jgi:UDP-3-O-[3-hydroxymyristoyl] N-acetylglucosamine deacetylase